MYKFFLRKKIKKILNLSERKKAYLNLKEIKSILVLFDTNNIDDANHFIQQMKKMNKKIKAVAFKSKMDNNNYSNTSFTFVTEKDMKDDSLVQIVNSLENEKIDLIVDLTLKENLLLLYILISTDSPLKVGFYKHAMSVHDMVISFAPGLVQNVKELGNQLIHYLTIISSEEKN